LAEAQVSHDVEGGEIEELCQFYTSRATSDFIQPGH
jgi:hypothetical protein